MTRDDVVAVLARRQEALDRRDWEAFRAVYAEDARLESPLAGTVLGPDAIVSATDAFFVAFPEAVIAAQPPIVDGDRAVVVAEVAGTHVGAIMGLPPSGRAFRLLSTFVFVLRDHRIIEERRIYDFTGLLIQIGVLKAKPA
jgi:steroid delta-isomerase-like uncharacterized protein